MILHLFLSFGQLLPGKRSFKWRIYSESKITYGKQDIRYSLMVETYSSGVWVKLNSALNVLCLFVVFDLLTCLIRLAECAEVRSLRIIIFFDLIVGISEAIWMYPLTTRTLTLEHAEARARQFLLLVKGLSAHAVYSLIWARCFGEVCRPWLFHSQLFILQSNVVFELLWAIYVSIDDENSYNDLGQMNYSSPR